MFFTFSMLLFIQNAYLFIMCRLFLLLDLFFKIVKKLFLGVPGRLQAQLIVDRMFHSKAVGLFYRQSAELSVGSSAPSSDRTISTDDYSASKGNRTLAVSFTSVVSRAFPFIATRNRIFEPISLYFRPFFVIFPQCFSLSSLITQKFNMGP